MFVGAGVYAGSMDIEPGTEYTLGGVTYEVLSSMYDPVGRKDCYWVRAEDTTERVIAHGMTIRKALKGGNLDKDEDKVLTPEQEQELIDAYGPEGPAEFLKNLKTLKNQFPGFFEVS